nr:immunoglobulin heavy chain junction region [Macaca mulatta]MOX02519.1 immunoglobulin heavy chain junction region [Macaca mulatta]MOX05768.1 immunoglobulin heavy chain junction region [Macaca mulatta]MOX06827.1 immunoglobulin heavy chain junction region [Macaca mulatta]
CARDQSDFDSW